MYQVDSFEEKALAQVRKIDDPVTLRKMVTNARGKSEVVEKAAFQKLVSISTGHPEGTVQHDCWAMLHAIEELRRLAGRKVWRMNRMRPKIERDGEIGALEYCALNKTDGFDEVVAYGLPELTAEAIVLRHATHFSAAAIAAARDRLKRAGLD